MPAIVELDQFEAAAKLHKMKEAAQRKKHAQKKIEKAGLEFKSDEENPYDSEEQDYDYNEKENLKAEQEFEDENGE